MQQMCDIIDCHMYTANCEYNRCLLQSHTCIQQMCDQYVEYNRCLHQSHTCIQQMCDVVICWI